MKPRKLSVQPNYLLFYNKRCSPHIKQFKTLKAAQDFVGKFERSDDDWVDFIISGKLIRAYEGFSGFVTVQSKVNKEKE